MGLIFKINPLIENYDIYIFRRLMKWMNFLKNTKIKEYEKWGGGWVIIDIEGNYKWKKTLGNDSKMRGKISIK